MEKKLSKHPSRDKCMHTYFPRPSAARSHLRVAEAVSLASSPSPHVASVKRLPQCDGKKRFSFIVFGEGGGRKRGNSRGERKGGNEKNRKEREKEREGE